LSDLQIDWGGVETELIYPRALPDLFHGSQLLMVGRYRPKAKRSAFNSSFNSSGALGRVFALAMPMIFSFASTATEQPAFRLTLTGKVNGRERRFAYDNLQFPETQRDNEFLAHLWAMRRVGHLLDQIRLNGESKELRDEIVALGTRYGIVTPYTSALVLEPGLQVSGINRPTSGRSRVGDLGGYAKIPERPAEVARQADSGEFAVRDSKEKEELRKADKIRIGNKDEAANSTMRQVAGKTFYLRDGIWTDSEFKADAKLPEVSLEFASEGYFKLINQLPKLADYFALGQRVVVVWQGKIYRVTE